MIYIYDARYNLKTPTTWEKLEGIVGTKKATLMTLKSKKQKLPRLDYCYIVDDNTPKKQYRDWYEKVKFENETWKDIDETYKVSNYGRILNMTYKMHPQGKFILTYPKRGCRTKTSLFIKIHGKEVRVSKLVAKYFVENPNNLPCVYHKNGILHDNYHGNLEYCTTSEIASIASKTRRKNNSSIVAIDSETGEIIDYFKDAPTAANVLYTNRQSVYDSLHGKTKKTYCGYIFKYEEEVI